MITMDFRTANNSQNRKQTLERFGIIGSAIDIMTSRRGIPVSQRYEKNENTYHRIRNSTGSHLRICSFKL